MSYAVGRKPNPCAIVSALSIFITLEGIEGTGKSTQSTRLVKRLRAEGYDCLLTREPGGTAIGREVRQVILSPKNHRMCAETELGLYFSDRAQHLREIVWPALDAGRIVVSDRFTDSTLAYQGHGRGLPLRLIRSLDRIMTGTFRPTVTLLLDLPAEEGLRRARQRNRESAAHGREGRFEEEELAFHQRVRRGYAKMAKNEPERYVTVSAAGTVKDVHEALWKALRSTRKLPRSR
jgi:dTMP kinase